MVYTKDEVVSLYRRAKNKKREIRILVELTCSDVDTILAILEDAGEFEGDYRICTRCGIKYPAESGRGRAFCPVCRTKEREINEKRYQLKRVTAKIQQLGLESARIRADIERLQNEK